MNIIKSFCNLFRKKDVKSIFKKKDGIWKNGIQILTEKELKDPLVKSFYGDKECPNCHIKPIIFLEGPHGGMNTNIQCCSCGSRFNICPDIGFIERIG